jgi:hypothetical protein
VDPGGMAHTTGRSTLKGHHPHLRSIIIGNDGFGVVLQAYQQAGATSAAGALAANNFFSITITANPGSVLDLTSLVFDAGPGGFRSAPDSGYFVRSSADGFATDLFSQTYPAGPQTAPATQTISLLAPEFQNLDSVLPSESRYRQES